MVEAISKTIIGFQHIKNNEGPFRERRVEDKLDIHVVVDYWD
jgi:hypothetical protein